MFYFCGIHAFKLKFNNEERDLLFGRRNLTGNEKCQTIPLIDGLKRTMTCDRLSIAHNIIVGNRLSRATAAAVNVLRFVIIFSIGTFVSLQLDAGLTFRSDEIPAKMFNTRLQKKEYTE